MRFLQRFDKNFDKYYTLFVGIPLAVYIGYHAKTLLDNTCNTKEHGNHTSNNK
jgi:hypothetical protein